MLASRLAVVLLLVMASSLAGADGRPHAYREIKDALKAGRYVDVGVNGKIVATLGQGRFLLDIGSNDILP